MKAAPEEPERRKRRRRLSAARFADERERAGAGNFKAEVRKDHAGLRLPQKLRRFVPQAFGLYLHGEMPDFEKRSVRFPFRAFRKRFAVIPRLWGRQHSRAPAAHGSLTVSSLLFPRRLASAAALCIGTAGRKGAALRRAREKRHRPFNGVKPFFAALPPG